jgi:FAD/FMN-containing dehydrogenase
MRNVSAKPAALLVAAMALALACSSTPAPTPPDTGVVVNDVHSKLNETRVRRVVSPDSIEAIQAIIRQARAEGRAISIAGGRHAMGGQQFGTDTILLDMGAEQVLDFDGKGLLVVQPGIRWPELLADPSAARGSSPGGASVRNKPAPTG